MLTVRAQENKNARCIHHHDFRDAMITQHWKWLVVDRSLVTRPLRKRIRLVGGSDVVFQPRDHHAFGGRGAGLASGCIRFVLWLSLLAVAETGVEADAVDGCGDVGAGDSM